PIPNREVKPRHADGTAQAGEQVAADPYRESLFSPHGGKRLFAFGGGGEDFSETDVADADIASSYDGKDSEVTSENKYGFQ
ncbi:MAG: hypothetical protein LBK07_00675, partial [Tannerella sp.]|nr:hypothetical protein [Tannerella sp.]